MLTCSSCTGHSSMLIKPLPLILPGHRSGCNRYHGGGSSFEVIDV